MLSCVFVNLFQILIIIILCFHVFSNPPFQFLIIFILCYHVFMNLPPWLLIVVILCFCVLLNFLPQLLIMVILCSHEASLALDHHHIVLSHSREPSRLLFIIVLCSHEPSSWTPNCHYVFMFLWNRYFGFWLLSSCVFMFF